MNYVNVYNHQAVPAGSIPELGYDAFMDLNTSLLQGHPERHCAIYFGYREGDSIRLICCIADDGNSSIMISSSRADVRRQLVSFTAKNTAFEKFEREIHENFGIQYSDHPWLKPVRYPEQRADLTEKISGYPFFSIKGEEVHEVGVGPVHAGIIEPGHFRFICNGEQILHLEIQLGYQHRGVEQLYLDRKKLLQRTILSESIAGDSVVGHTTAFACLWESLCGFSPERGILYSRTLAQELERIAIHTGDLSALCADVAYQLGSSVFGRLRTPVINFFQEWCGNRLAKGLIRVGYNPFPLSEALANRLRGVLDDFEPDFVEMNNELTKMPSCLSRFERTGALDYDQLLSIGAVGMTARMNGLRRDIRSSHPYGAYGELEHIPVIKHHGDVYSRVQIRKEEVRQSIRYIKGLLEMIPDRQSAEKMPMKPGPGIFVISLTEGWRGEICHAAITDSLGELLVYKVKDPSFHNWLALALAVRNNEISDFPVCNKSFNLSYCGHDL